MDLSVRSEDLAFLEEAHEFLAALQGRGILRQGSAAWHSSGREQVHAWLAALSERGWSTPHWPIEYGGADWSPLRQFLFEIECARAGAPDVPSQGLRLAGPTIIAFGSDDQKARFLPGTADGSIVWCQGFSEPEAGSDLASLKTRARLSDDVYIVNGQKIWTTYAHEADWMFALVRTGEAERGRNGISMLLIDMSLPGVTVTPIETIDAEAHVNSVFFDDVNVPVSCLVGAEGQGWEYARYLLERERTGGAKLPQLIRDLQLIDSLAEIVSENGVRAADTDGFRRRMTAIRVELDALRWSILRVLCGDASCSPAEMASILKVRGSELQQATAQLAIDVLGASMLSSAGPLAGDAEAALTYLGFRRAATIYAGSDEIQRNLLSRMILQA